MGVAEEQLSQGKKLRALRKVFWVTISTVPKVIYKLGSRLNNKGNLKIIPNRYLERPPYARTSAETATPSCSLEFRLKPKDLPYGLPGC